MRTGTSNRGWRWQEVLLEGVRISSSANRHGLVTCIASAACLVLAALAEALPTHSITQQEQRWISSGGHILIVSTSDDGVIDGAACDGLATLSGVEGAFGARRAAVPLVEASRPGSVFAATLTTPGVVDFFTAAPAVAIRPTPTEGTSETGTTGGAIVLTEARPETDPATTALLPYLDSPLAPVHAADLSVLGDERATDVLLVSADLGGVDRCFVRSSPESQDTVASVLPLLLGGTEGVVVSPRLANGALDLTPEQRQEQRHPFFVAALLGAALGLLVGLRWWMSRREDALLITLGARAPEIRVLRVVEFLTGMAGGSILAMQVCLLMALIVGPLQPAVLAYGARGALVAFAVSLVVAGLATLRPMRSVTLDLRE